MSGCIANSEARALPPGGFARVAWPAFAALLAAEVAWVAAAPAHSPARSLPAAALVVGLALLATVAGLARRLPAANAVAAAGTVFGLTTAALLLGRAGLPLGPADYPPGLGPRCLGLVPVAFPLAWVGLLLNSRGLARRLVYGARPAVGRGRLVIGWAVPLTLLGDGLLQHWARAAAGVWGAGTPTGVPLAHYPVAAAFSALNLILLTPWLIDKHPSAPRPADAFPALIWAVLLAGLALADWAAR